MTKWDIKDFADSTDESVKAMTLAEVCGSSVMCAMVMAAQNHGLEVTFHRGGAVSVLEVATNTAGHADNGSLYSAIEDFLRHRVWED